VPSAWKSAWDSVERDPDQNHIDGYRPKAENTPRAEEHHDDREEEGRSCEVLGGVHTSVIGASRVVR